MKYILVTASRNEGDNLPRLISSIVIQTIKPALWLIMNDNSTDNSEQIILEAEEKYDFIYNMNLSPATYDLAWRYHEIMSNGFIKAIELCKTNQIVWNFIGVLDGDIFFKDNDYFECLINKVKENSKIWIASGGILSFNGVGYKREVLEKNKPIGAARLITAACYESIGYPIIPSGDSVMRILANEKGYETIRVEETVAYQSRATNAGQSEWKAGLYEGYVKYYLGYTYYYLILKILSYISRGKIIRASGFSLSVLKNMIFSSPRTESDLVKDYFSAALKRKLTN